MAEKTLVDADKYLKTGSHIGTRFKSGDMNKYVYKQRKDGLKVLDVQVLDSRIKTAIKFLSRFEPETIAVVSRKLYGQSAVKEFAKAIGAKEFTGRFVPGTFTNPQGKGFFEPNVVLVTEPEADEQAIFEAKRLRVPVVALCSTNNSLKDIDLCVPINNKGRKSLALFYWVAAKEISKELKLIKKDEDFKKTLEDFEYQLKEERDEKEEGFSRQRVRRFQKKGKRRGKRR